MTKRDRIELLRRGARTGLTTLVFLVVAGSGLFVAGMTWSAGTNWGVAQGERIADYLPASGDPQQSMTPNGRPVGEPSSHLILPLILKTDNSEKRFSVADRVLIQSCRRAGEVRDRALPCTSTSGVDSRLGRQFTLVGAKPSGTG